PGAACHAFALPPLPRRPMFDLRPPLHIVGLVLVVTGLFMLFPAAVDYGAGNGNWGAFAQSSLVTTVFGALLALACDTGRRSAGLNVRQAFLMTGAGWMLVPVFGALPLMSGVPQLGFTDAYFEAVSG